MSRLDAALAVALLSYPAWIRAAAFHDAEALGVRLAHRPLVDAISEEVRREIEAL